MVPLYISKLEVLHLLIIYLYYYQEAEIEVAVVDNEEGFHGRKPCKVSLLSLGGKSHVQGGMTCHLQPRMHIYRPSKDICDSECSFAIQKWRLRLHGLP